MFAHQEASEKMSIFNRLSKFTSQVSHSIRTPTPKRQTQKNSADNLISRRYELLAQIGEGGMGRVYEAYDHELDRKVAVKVLKTEAVEDANDVQRFYYEAEVLTRLDHPGLIPIFGAGFDENHGSYFVMKLIEGNTLADILEMKHRVALLNSGLIHIFEQVCKTVSYAHSQGFVHRDLKPDNIMVDNAGNVHLMDWGLAKRISGKTPRDNLTDTETGVIKGTPLYMSPEQVSGDSTAVDFRSDVFALGIILYEILTNRSPFSGDTPLAVLTKIRQSSPKAPIRVNEKVSPILNAICMKALAKNPSERYDSANDLLIDIRQYLEGEFPSAYEPPISVVVCRYITNHAKLATSFFTLLCVAIVIGFFAAYESSIHREMLASFRQRLVYNNSIMESLHNQLENSQQQLAKADVSAEKKTQLIEESEELRALLLFLRVNSWNLVNHLSRSKETRSNEYFIAKNINRDVDTMLKRGHPHSAHLFLTVLLEQNEGPHRKIFNETLRKELSKKRREIEETMKVAYGLTPPNWSKHLDWLDLPSKS